MSLSQTKNIHVNPSMELKNVAKNRILYLQIEQKKQSLLLHALQKTENDNIMSKYVDSREISAKKQSSTLSPEKDADLATCIDAQQNQKASCAPILSFNDQVSKIISLQDQILVDYLRVCNLRLGSHEVTLPCSYTKEATDYMSILTALITALITV